jgi:hypothetical protein
MDAAETAKERERSGFPFWEPRKKKKKDRDCHYFQDLL